MAFAYEPDIRCRPIDTITMAEYVLGRTLAQLQADPLWRQELVDILRDKAMTLMTPQGNGNLCPSLRDRHRNSVLLDAEKATEELPLLFVRLLGVTRNSVLADVVRKFQTKSRSLQEGLLNVGDQIWTLPRSVIHAPVVFLRVLLCMHGAVRTHNQRLSTHTTTTTTTTMMTFAPPHPQHSHVGRDHEAEEHKADEEEEEEEHKQDQSSRPPVQLSTGHVAATSFSSNLVAQSLEDARRMLYDRLVSSGDGGGLQRNGSAVFAEHTLVYPAMGPSAALPPLRTPPIMTTFPAFLASARAWLADDLL
jgi:hypothetical protein